MDFKGKNGTSLHFNFRGFQSQFAIYIKSFKQRVYATLHPLATVENMKHAICGWLLALAFNGQLAVDW